MIRCIAIDDEPLALTQISEYIKKIPYLSLTASCLDAFEAMEIMSKEKVDLMFVDINMPDLNGLDMVKSLKEPPVVIFTTAYSEYAIEGFRVNAIDYLLKPFSMKDFIKATDKAREWIEFKAAQKGKDGGEGNVDEESLFVKSEYSMIRIRFDEIKYIEGMSDYVRIYIEGRDKPVMSLLSIKGLEERLPSDRFMRVHRSYIVNLEKIREVTRLRIVFGNTYIPVGENYKEKFNSYIKERLW